MTGAGYLFRRTEPMANKKNQVPKTKVPKNGPMVIRAREVLLHSPNPFHVAAKSVCGAGVHGDTTRRTERRDRKQEERNALLSFR